MPTNHRDTRFEDRAVEPTAQDAALERAIASPDYKAFLEALHQGKWQNITVESRNGSSDSGRGQRVFCVHDNHLFEMSVYSESMSGTRGAAVAMDGTQLFNGSVDQHEEDMRRQFGVDRNREAIIHQVNFISEKIYDLKLHRCDDQQKTDACKSYYLARLRLAADGKYPIYGGDGPYTLPIKYPQAISKEAAANLIEFSNCLDREQVFTCINDQTKGRTSHSSTYYCETYTKPSSIEISLVCTYSSGSFYQKPSVKVSFNGHQHEFKSGWRGCDPFLYAFAEALYAKCYDVSQQLFEKKVQEERDIAEATKTLCGKISNFDVSGWEVSAEGWFGPKAFNKHIGGLGMVSIRKRNILSDAHLTIDGKECSGVPQTTLNKFFRTLRERKNPRYQPYYD
jgi:hypothetical protein